MASLEEMLKYLEQFMQGQLNQHPSASAAAGMAGAGATAAGGAPGGAMAGGGMPAGAMPGAAPAVPAALAGASPEDVQGALSQFSADHPELAGYLPSAGDISDLQSLVGQLVDLPPQALEAFAASGGLDQVESLVDQTLGSASTPGTAQPFESDLGAPLSSEFGDLSGFGGFDDPAAGSTAHPSDFTSFLASSGPADGLPEVLTAGTTGEFGDLAGVQYSDLGITPPDGAYVTSTPPEFDFASAFPTVPSVEADTYSPAYEPSYTGEDPAPVDTAPLDTATLDPATDADVDSSTTSYEPLEDHAAYVGSGGDAPNDPYDQ